MKELESRCLLILPCPCGLPNISHNHFMLLAVLPLVYKNDELSLVDVFELVQSGKVHNIVISPGPGTPHSPQDIGKCPAKQGRPVSCAVTHVMSVMNLESLA